MLEFTTYPTEQVNPTDSAWQTHKGENTLMENTQDELRAHLMKTDEGFRRLAEQHAQYHKQLEAIEAKPHLTPEEELEEHRLKKLKLRLKDQMNGIISRNRAQNVA
ncbi:MAG TPA: DUF465 domain-containing protein [Bryobacteraceae bacterium]|jgi:uncharacterized protein YdcH (DUF465 family)|nr:DUF465 domain-containing protein [Bryobacteraceae bacterium]